MSFFTALGTLVELGVVADPPVEAIVAAVVVTAGEVFVVRVGTVVTTGQHINN